VAIKESPKLSAARALARAGYSLVPLCSLKTPHTHGEPPKPCKTLGKVPAIKGWRMVAPLPEQVEKLGVVLSPSAYGVVLRADDVVIDVDPRNFKPNDRPLARLVEKIGCPLPPTFTVKSGAGGLHLYYKKPVGFDIVRSLAAFPGIDFKTSGGFVVGPGSDHFSGKQYAVASHLSDPLIIAEAPTALLALLCRPVVATDPTAADLPVTDDAETRARFFSYLNDQAPVTGSFKVACRGRDLGLSQAATYELMLEVWNPRRPQPKDPDELRLKVAHAYEYASGKAGADNPASDFTALEPKAEQLPWHTIGQGQLKRDFHNLMLMFKHRTIGLTGLFAYNEFRGRAEFTRRAPWHKATVECVTDADVTLLKNHLVQTMSFEASVPQIEEAITVAAHELAFHPVREYFEGLTWDKVPRLDGWLNRYLGVADNPYTRACARKVICAAVMRTMTPGCVFDHVLVLEGRQGVGKSSVVKILGGQWAGDFPLDPHDKDSVQLAQGHLFIEIAELEVTRRADLQALKAFLTRTTDKARFAYGRRVAELPRQFVFIGSINPGADGTYLKDDENRRWWPVACGDTFFDLPGLKKVRDQLFAEAVHVLKTTREPLGMHTPELRALAAAEVARRRQEHPWVERIAGWLKESERMPETRKTFWTNREIYVGAMGGSDRGFDRAASSSVSEAMKILGWEYGVDASGRKGWRRDLLGDLA
jgi:predicted P-loop ATPase